MCMKLKVIEPEESVVAAQDNPWTIEGRNRQQHHADGEDVPAATGVDTTVCPGISGGLVAGIHKSGLVRKEKVSLPLLDESIPWIVSQTIQIIPPSPETFS